MPYTRPDFDEALLNFRLFLKLGTPSRLGSRSKLSSRGYTFMSRNKQSRKYLIDRSYKNDKFDWPFLFGDCIIARHESITPLGVLFMVIV